MDKTKRDIDSPPGLLVGLCQFCGVLLVTLLVVLGILAYGLGPRLVAELMGWA